MAIFLRPIAAHYRPRGRGRIKKVISLDYVYYCIVILSSFLLLFYYYCINIIVLLFNCYCIIIVLLLYILGLSTEAVRATRTTSSQRPSANAGAR